MFTIEKAGGGAAWLLTLFYADGLEADWNLYPVVLDSEGLDCGWFAAFERGTDWVNA